MATQTREFLAEDAALGAREAIEYCYQQGWTDGLPVVPPIQEFVDEFLAQTHRDPGEVLLVQEHLNRSCNIREAAVNAVMAGCRPEYFPVVLAVMDSLHASGITRSGLLQSTTGQAEIIVVNGPLRESLSFNSTNNIFGPGDRANATVGRALRLIVMNVLGIRPHEFDQSTQGTSSQVRVLSRRERGGESVGATACRARLFGLPEHGHGPDDAQRPLRRAPLDAGA